jgi:membrane protein DedA with SNARE-associated domain
MDHLVSTTIAFIRDHAAWAFPIMFVTAFGESFVFVSLLFPGTTILIASGVFVGNGTLPFWPPVLGAILGAVLGDSISYWLGLHYGKHITLRWPLSRHPELVERGEYFFERFGTLSVFVGRFFGPVRATIPLVAGILKMAPTPFWIANVGSAIIWAPALVFFGAIAQRLWTAVPGGTKHLLIAVGIVLLLGALWLINRIEWSIILGPRRERTPKDGG